MIELLLTIKCHQWWTQYLTRVDEPPPPPPLVSGRVFVSQHGVFQVIDTFTFQVDAEQQSSGLFSHGAVSAETPGHPGDHAGEFVSLQLRLLPHWDFGFRSEHLLQQIHRAARNAARIGAQQAAGTLR